MTALDTLPRLSLAIDALLDVPSDSQMQEAKRALSELKDKLKNANAYLPRYDQSQYQQVSISCFHLTLHLVEPVA